jgi:hypothetical protein
MQRCRVLTGMRVCQVTGVGGRESVFTLVHSFRGTDLAGHRWILQLNSQASRSTDMRLITAAQSAPILAPH